MLLLDSDPDRQKGRALVADQVRTGLCVGQHQLVACPVAVAGAQDRDRLRALVKPDPCSLRPHRGSPRIVTEASYETSPTVWNDGSSMVLTAAPPRKMSTVGAGNADSLGAGISNRPPFHTCRVVTCATRQGNTQKQ